MTELKRTFDARAIAILTVGTVIGSGIFLVPSSVLRDSGGSVGLAILVWVVAGVLSYLGALTYAELGAMNPSSGGLYVYIRDAFGRAPAFVYGFTLFVVIASGTVATLAVASSTYLAQLMPLSPVTRKVISLIVVAALTMVNVRGTQLSAQVINVATALKLAAIALMVIALPALGSGFSQIHRWFPERMTGSLLSSVGIAMIAVLWAYEGWQYITFIAGETVEPQRNFPKGLAWGVIGLIIVYVTASTAYVAGIGPDQVMGAERVAADATAQVLGPGWAKLVALIIVTSMLSAAQGNTLTAARVYYALAKEGLFFEKMGGIHPRFGTPAFALITSGIWSGALALSGTFETLLTYVIFVGWIFYSLGGLAVIALRRKLPNAARPYRVPGYPMTPVLFVLSGLVIVVNTIVSNPRRGAIGVGATLLAVPIYFIWKRGAGASSLSPKPRP